MKIFLTILSVLAAILFAGCAGSSEPTSRADLEKDFQSEFGFLPDTNVSNIKSKTVQVGDTWMRWIRFTYSSSTFTNIVNAGFTPAKADVQPTTPWQQNALTTSPNPNAPKWWKSPGTLVGKVFYKENFRKDIAASYAYVWVDETEGMIYSSSAAWQ